MCLISVYEPLYKFFDKSGHCFKDYSNIEDSTDYHKIVAIMLVASHKGDKLFSVGDMLCFRDELQADGFVWGIDFFVKKV